MKNTLALVLMVFGIVGCASTTDGKLVTFFGMQASHNVPWWAGEKIVASYDDITLKHKALAINQETKEEFFYAEPYEDSDSEILPYANKYARKQAYELCEYYAKPYGYWEYVESTPEVCFIDKVGDAQYIGTHNQKGEFHGNGTLIFANGDRFEGGFRNGSLYGSGTMHWSDGTYISGNFYNDKLIEEPSYNSSTSSSSFLGDAITTTGQIILGTLYIAVAVVGSPEYIAYQQDKKQNKRINQLESNVRSMQSSIRTRRIICNLNRNC